MQTLVYKLVPGLQKGERRKLIIIIIIVVLVIVAQKFVNAHYVSA